MRNRLLRINKLLQRKISAYLHSRYSSETVAITISGVEIAGDLRKAKIFYSVVGKDACEEKADKWLRRKLPEIRSVVANSVVIRHVPAFTVHYDNSDLRAVRIESILDHLDFRQEGV